MCSWVSDRTSRRSIAASRSPSTTSSSLSEHSACSPRSVTARTSSSGSPRPNDSTRPSGNRNVTGNEADASRAETRSGSPVPRPSGTRVERLQRLFTVAEAFESRDLAVAELGDVHELRLDLHMAALSASDGPEEDRQAVPRLTELVRLDADLLPGLVGLFEPSPETAVAAVLARAEAAPEDRLGLHVLGEDLHERVEAARAPRGVGGARPVYVAWARSAA